MSEFGYHTVGTGGTDNPSSNVIWAKATSTPASNGTLTTISVHVNSILSGTPKVVVAIYSDSSGAPDALLASNTTGVTATANSWIDVSCSYGSITSGTQYWFCFYPAPNNGASDYSVDFDTNGGATEGYFLGIGAGSFPANGVGATGFTGERFSIYGTYTAVGGTFNPTPIVDYYAKLIGRRTF